MGRLLVFILCHLGIASFCQTAKLELKNTKVAPIINKHIYGFFTEHIGRGVYDGFYGSGGIRKKVASALTAIAPANLRWPGGRFAEDYHWRDGIGDISLRPKRINKHWGNVVEDNRFGTDEYLSFCSKIGADAVIVANVQTATASELVDWLGYLKGKSTYLHIGNQSWAYTDSIDYVRRFTQYLSAVRATTGGDNVKLIAVGPGRDNVKWTKAMMSRLPLDQIWGISFHHYVYPMDANGKYAKSSSKFDEQEYFSAISQSLAMDSLIRQHTEIMDKFDPKKKVGLVIGEWGVRVKDSLAILKHGDVFQYGTMREALCAATMLNVFNNNSDRVRMANIAQTVNVLHSVIITDGNNIVKTPTYFVFKMMKAHQDAKRISFKISSPKYFFNGKSMDAVNASASVRNGIINITLVNADPKNKTDVILPFNKLNVEADLLKGSTYDSMNKFGQSEVIKLREFKDFKLKDGQLIVSLPPLSIVQLRVKNAHDYLKN